MGFFTSRKPEGEGPIITDKSVVKVIRSRFVSHKGKGRETSHTTEQHTGLHTPKHAPGSPLRTETRADDISVSPSTRHRPPAATNGATPTPNRPSADAVTVTLTQRLNELAVANSEGLLNDDEYRLLRQNLFERFATGNQVPTEAPVVPVRGRSRRNEGISSASVPSSPAQPSSKFQVNPARLPRTPSLRSQSSIKSTMSSMFRRGPASPTSTSKESMSNDTSSLFSLNSSTSQAFRLPRLMTRKLSSDSVRTETSRSPYDPSASHRIGDPPDPHFHTRGLSRSNTPSLRRLAQPPSSFHTRGVGSDPRQQNMTDLFDEQSLTTAKDIRLQIEVVEAEGRRLLDAFNGLELTTLTRRSKEPGRLAVPGSPASESRQPGASVWPSGRSRLQGSILESDTASIGSMSTTAPSVHSRKHHRPRPLPGVPLASQPVSLQRKNSLSSVTSRALANVPSSQSLTASPLGRGLGSSSSINLARSNTHLPLTSVSEGGGSNWGGDEDVEFSALETEMADIRQRRAEVTARYEARLEYLRAKLKGAELHEKLLKR
ncbi:hypothetical protein PLICRDRAFT_55729 [Plicaturopsis crispa FD-325 SS-3]|nr:hypothetical protein PLICRDRAFT_55729 [Plicaturopsis crispa FD-325 SS-3]